MTYQEFLTKAISYPIKHVQTEHANSEDNLKGSIDALDACKNSDPEELVDLFNTVYEYKDKGTARWYIMSYLANISWLCNVVSAWYESEGKAPFFPGFPNKYGAKEASIIANSKLL